MPAAPASDRAPLAFLFDLDGTLVDSVYQHVLAWQEALQQAGISATSSLRPSFTSSAGDVA